MATLAIDSFLPPPEEGGDPGKGTAFESSSPGSFVESLCLSPPENSKTTDATTLAKFDPQT